MRRRREGRFLCGAHTHAHIGCNMCSVARDVTPVCSSIQMVFDAVKASAACMGCIDVSGELGCSISFVVIVCNGFEHLRAFFPEDADASCEVMYAVYLVAKRFVESMRGAYCIPQCHQIHTNMIEHVDLLSRV